MWNIWNKPEEEASNEAEGQDSEQEDSISLPEMLQGLSDEELARLAKECRAKRSQRPSDRQLRDQYIEIQKELARRGASA